MQSLGRRYVRHINDVYRRTGTLWEGRYRAAPIDSEAWFLAWYKLAAVNPLAVAIEYMPGYGKATVSNIPVIGIPNGSGALSTVRTRLMRERN